MSHIDGRGPTIILAQQSERKNVIEFARQLRSTELLGSRGVNETSLYGVRPDAPDARHETRAKTAKTKLRGWLAAKNVDPDGVPALQEKSADPVLGSHVLSALGLNAVSPHTSERKLEIASGMVHDERPPLAEKARPLIAVVMGQGVIGRLDRHRFCSDSFSSCMPVILYNHETKLGGLFHLPFPKLDADEVNFSDQGVPEALAEMVRLIKPTEIVLRPGGSQQENEWKSYFTLFELNCVRKVTEPLLNEFRSMARANGLESNIHFEDIRSSMVTVTIRDGNLSIDNQSCGSADAVVSRNNTLPDHFAPDVLSWSTYIHEADSSVVNRDFFCGSWISDLRRRGRPFRGQLDRRRVLVAAGRPRRAGRVTDFAYLTMAAFAATLATKSLLSGRAASMMR